MQVFDESFKNPTGDWRETFLRTATERATGTSHPSVSADPYHLGTGIWSHIFAATDMKARSNDVPNSLFHSPLRQAVQDIERIRHLQRDEAINVINYFVVEEMSKLLAEPEGNGELWAESRRQALAATKQVTASLVTVSNRTNIFAVREGLLCSLGAGHAATARASMTHALKLLHDLGPVFRSAPYASQRDQLADFVVRIGELISRLDESKLLTDRQYVVDHLDTVEALRCCSNACSALTALIKTFAACVDKVIAATNAYALAVG